jgi:hypothetical protein
MYVNGSAGTNSTCDNNLEAFRKWNIVPRMLVDASHRNLKACHGLCVFMLDYLLTHGVDNIIRSGIPKPDASRSDRRWRYRSCRWRTRCSTCSKDRWCALYHEYSLFSIYRRNRRGKWRRPSVVSIILVYPSRSAVLYFL